MNKNLISSLSAIAILACVFFLSSCEKDNNLTSQSEKSSVMSDMLFFKSSEQFNQELEKVLNMTPEELKNYEESKGYFSIGRACQELYEESNIENFSSKEEFISFVEKNSKYLQLLETDGGEYELETSLYKFPQRFFLNQDHTLHVDTMVYKFFEEGVISCRDYNLDILKDVNEENLTSFIKNPEITYYSLSNNPFGSRLKDAAYNCGTSKTARATKKRDRTKIDISIFHLHTYDEVHPAGPIPLSIINNRVLVRPYKRTMGIWYHCSRTISCGLKIAVDRKINGIWEREFINYSNTKKASKIELTLEGGVISFGYHSEIECHYGGLDCWGDTPSTGHARIQCNTSLVN